MKRGILYIATGAAYIEEAKRSAQQVKSVSDIPIAIVSDEPVDSPWFDHEIVDENPQYDYLDKPRNLLKSPFEKTIFLDTDAYVLDTLDELFHLLDEIELAAVADPNEYMLRYKGDVEFPNIPDSAPEYNTGVLAYKQTTGVQDCFETWMSLCEAEQRNDQAAFRAALYSTELNFSSLSPIYNCLLGWPMQVIGPVKVIHDSRGLVGTVVDLSDVERRVNRTTKTRILYNYGDRVYHPVSGTGNVITRVLSTVGLLYRHPRLFMNEVATNDIRSALKKTGNWIRQQW